MVCRALGFAAVLLLVCGGLARPVQAQENLDAGKSPSQLFAGTCSACHKSPRGLLKTIPAGSLPGFLRQHYTTGPDMAGVLAGYLVSNGASDTRATGGKSGRASRSEAKPETEAAPVERTGRRHRRSAAEPAGEAAPAPEAAAGADAAPKPHTRHKSAKHKRGRPAGDDAAKPDAANEPSEAARPVAGEKPAAETRAEAPKTEAPKESEPTLRVEPAPTITQSIPSASSTGAGDPSVPTAPAER